MVQLVKNPPAIRETWVRSLGWEDPLEKGTATNSGISGLENSMDCIVMGSQTVGQIERLFTSAGPTSLTICIIYYL